MVGPVLVMEKEQDTINIVFVINGNITAVSQTTVFIVGTTSRKVKLIL